MRKPEIFAATWEKRTAISFDGERKRRNASRCLTFHRSVHKRLNLLISWTGKTVAFLLAALSTIRIFVGSDATFPSHSSPSVLTFNGNAEKVPVACGDAWHPPGIKVGRGDTLRTFEIYEIEVERDPKLLTVADKVVGGKNISSTFYGKTWTSLDGRMSANPSDISPPPGWEWTSDWKIDVSGDRDTQGWEYIDFEVRKPASKALLRQYSMRRRRRRRWLRTMQPIPQLPLDQEVFPTREKERVGGGIHRGGKPPVPVAPVKKKRKRTGFVKKALSAVRQDFNFKGFGWSFYKSMIFRESVGAAFRLPLSVNFDCFERRPHLPSISSSLGIFYPWTVAFFLSMSLPCEFLRYVIFTLLRCIQHAILSTLLVLTGMKSKVNLPPIDRTALRYSQNVQERIAVARENNGLPSASVTATQVKRRSMKEREVMEWLRHRTASLGLSTGYPIPVPPFYSFNVVLSLSGFQYLNFVGDIISQTRQQQREKKEQELIAESLVEGVDSIEERP